MPRMTNSTPARKVVAGSLSAAISTIVLWALKEFIGIEIPDAIQAAVLTVVVFVVGYLVPPSAEDTVMLTETSKDT